MRTFIAALFFCLSTSLAIAAESDAARCVACATAQATELAAAAQVAFDRAGTRTGDVEPINARLAAMRERDQRIREIVMAAMRECKVDFSAHEMAELRRTGRAIDKANQAALEAILRDTGWPVISRFGEEADQAAFLVAQHADRNPDLQQRVLERLTELVRKGETSGENFALLFDRVQVAKGQPQRYGSQGACSEGRWQAHASEAPQKHHFCRDLAADGRSLGMAVATPTPCSCFMCGHPRRWLGPTHQEARLLTRTLDTG